MLELLELVFLYTELNVLCYISCKAMPNYFVNVNFSA